MSFISDKNYEKVKSACIDAEIVFEAEDFPNGLETVLSREFGGVDLSGGQWQRVAIARGIYCSHDLIVLDEPTASIDPIEEAKVFRQFAKITKRKTAVIVTHRLGAAKIADKIIVIKDGKVDDVGKHDELLQRKGLYFKLYSEQAKWYIR